MGTGKCKFVHAMPSSSNVNFIATKKPIFWLQKCKNLGKTHSFFNFSYNRILTLLT